MAFEKVVGVIPEIYFTDSLLDSGVRRNDRTGIPPFVTPAKAGVRQGTISRKHLMSIQLLAY
jgi:hypothetical protein